MSFNQLDGLTSVLDQESMTEVQVALLERRRKRPHLKSRHGCVNCKRRRVKCDESYPSCKRCLKRGDACAGSLRQCHSRRDPIRSSPSSAASPALELSATHGTNLNLDDMSIFHHFQTSTYKTLPLVASVWKDAVGLAFDYEYLMHAVLSVAASHLGHLSQNEHYRILSRKHLSRALHLFREVLSKEVVEDNADALLSTSALIYHAVWSAPDPSTDRLYSASEDQVLALSGGMRHLFACILWRPLFTVSLYDRLVRHRPIKSIESTTVSLGRDTSELECFLAALYNNPGMISNDSTRQLPRQLVATIENPTKSVYSDFEPKSYDLQACAYDAYMNVASRLSILLSLLPAEGERQPTAASGKKIPSLSPDTQPELLGEAARVVYTFSLLFSPAFTSMLHDNDRRALLLIYYFYSMIQHLLPAQDCWWAVARAGVMQRRLARRLWG